MRSIIFASLFCVGAPACAQDAPPIPVEFQWPATEVGAIPDLREKEAVRRAIDVAREARSQALEARRIAFQEKARAGVQGRIGLHPSHATTDGETEITVTRGTSSGAKLGVVTYASGARMTGSLSENVGVYTGSPDSQLGRFSGFVWGATGSHPSPTTGIFEWKNGDTFVGSITGKGNHSEGIYTDADGGRKFVGTVDLSESEFRPVDGYLEDDSGQLLAVVVANE